MPRWQHEHALEAIRRRLDENPRAMRRRAEQALRDTLGCVMGHTHRMDFEAGLLVARGALSEQDFATAFEQGNAMSTEEFVGYALSFKDEASQ